MAVFKVETKNKVDIDKKPRVYFTCHPDDFGKYFKKICDDIFKTHDCTIYYTEDMSEIIAEDEKETDLGRMNLLVVPVTFKLLSEPNRAMDIDVAYALEKHIPVLPIMMESEIDEFYSKPDKFGELQYLNPYSTDLTEISYEEKLKKYLESVLIGDELAKRVRAAFDAYIFLSYRKKDRKYANKLMRLIHSIPGCIDIAIWFDEFLTPGESFKENIEKILDDCKLFTLLVTPQLLEKVVDENGEERDNYVISTELPLARKKNEEKGTDIFAVEMEDTDKDALSAISIKNYVNSGDPEFRTRLLNVISSIAITTNNTPEHNFLIGLAYLEGIDVELDYTNAVSLITSAADAGLVEAMKQLVTLYQKGKGVQIDYRCALDWQYKIMNTLLNKFTQQETVESFSDYFQETLKYILDLYYFDPNGLNVFGASKILEDSASFINELWKKRHKYFEDKINDLNELRKHLNNDEMALALQESLGRLRCLRIKMLPKTCLLYYQLLRSKKDECTESQATVRYLLSLCAEHSGNAIESSQYRAEAEQILVSISSENHLDIDELRSKCFINIMNLV